MIASMSGNQFTCEGSTQVLELILGWEDSLCRDLKAL